MAKAEWGMKRMCHTCGARFYDLRRDPILCPHCGAVFDPERQPKPKRPSPLLKEEPVAAKRLAGVGAAVDDDLAEVEAPDADLDELDDAAEGETADDELSPAGGELMEDTSELGEDDDDIGEVMEHVDDELEDKP